MSTETLADQILAGLTKNWTDFSGTFHATFAEILPEEYAKRVTDHSRLVASPPRRVYVSPDDKIGHDVVNFEVKLPTYRVVVWSVEDFPGQDEPVKSCADIVEFDGFEHEGKPTAEYVKFFAQCKYDDYTSAGDAVQVTVQVIPWNAGVSESQIVLTLPEPEMEEPEAPSPAEALLILAKCEMKPFDKMDWEAFAGCESDNPMIGYVDDWTVVVDGDALTLVRDGDEFGGTLFALRARF